MKHREIIVILLLIFILFESCIQTKSDFDIIAYADKKIDFANIVDTLSYKFIPLETTNLTIIGDIEKVEVSDSIIFILDSSIKMVYKFDFEGKYIGRIGEKGRGQGEYMEASNFIINHKDKQIILSEKSSGNILFYDFNGIFIRSCHIDTNPFAYLPNREEIVIFSLPLLTSEKYELRRFKGCSDNLIGGYIPRPNYKEKEAYMSTKKYFLQHEDDYFFIPLYTDDLYRLNDDGIELIYEFGFQNNMFDYDNAELTTDFYKSQKLGKIDNFYMNNEGSYMFKMMYGKDSQFDVYGNIHAGTFEAGAKLNTDVPISVLFGMGAVGVYNEYFINSISFAHYFPDYFPEATEDNNPILVFYKIKV